MDLFGDLPEPSTPQLNNKAPSPANSSLRPAKPLLSLHPGRDELFGDLPAPDGDAGSSSEGTSDGGGKAAKRKTVDEGTTSAPKKAASSHSFVLRGFWAERKGEREEMQDAHTVVDEFHREVPHLHPSVGRLSFYAVYDGHNGARASRFAAKHLHVNVGCKFPKGDKHQVEKEIKRCLIESFKKTDEEFLKEATKTKPSMKDGTTAIAVLAVDDVLYISNLGDSKAILCRYNEETQKHVAVPLSKDHVPTDYDERMRIQKARGSVRDGRVMGILEVSRSIGDGQFKTCGVISVPDVKRCHLTDKDRFLLLACDGLWKVFTSDEVIKLILDTLEAKGGDHKSSEDARFEAACTRLVSEAVRKFSGDNVTVVIVSIRSASSRPAPASSD